MSTHSDHAPPATAPRRPLRTPALRAASSPVRDLLALTERPEVISFAGGLPAPELFDEDGLREAFAAAWPRERRHARCSTEPRRATRHCASCSQDC